jgi:hypothetical protein
MEGKRIYVIAEKIGAPVFATYTLSPQGKENLITNRAEYWGLGAFCRPTAHSLPDRLIRAEHGCGYMHVRESIVVGR